MVRDTVSDTSGYGFVADMYQTSLNGDRISLPSPLWAWYFGIAKDIMPFAITGFLVSPERETSLTLECKDGFVREVVEHQRGRWHPRDVTRCGNPADKAGRVDGY